MELKDIAAVAGKGGLYKIVKPTRSGLILEQLGDPKQRLVTGPNHRVSVLHEISLYTTGVEETLPLKDVFSIINKEFGDDPGLEGKADKEELMSFIKHIAPNYDPEKVYPSDVKKIVTWYKLITAHCPEVLKDNSDEATAEGSPKPDQTA
ncbi:MAG: DUF5606 domain-containing protein [Cyclobacteriaceae bacterium]|nr:DUF5606 domain-containing protein [Cyclobacteriaceae bacterium]